MPSTGYLTATMTVDQTPDEVFAAITNVRGWWNENLIGDSAAVGDEFIFTDDCKYASETARDRTGIRFARFQLTEVVPGRRVVWHVVDSYLNFIDDRDEWTGTDVVFDIAAHPQGTTLHSSTKDSPPTDPPASKRARAAGPSTSPRACRS